MKTITFAIIAAVSALSLSAFASQECTQEPQAKWLTQADVKAKLEGQGYMVKGVKTDGSCLEIYAQTKDGKQIELYVNPVDAIVIKEEDKS